MLLSSLCCAIAKEIFGRAIECAEKERKHCNKEDVDPFAVERVEGAFESSEVVRGSSR